MLLQQVAMVSDVRDISTSELNQVAAALQRQASRDLGPIWAVEAAVSAFPRLRDVPIGYWPILIQEDIRQQGAAGIHLDAFGQPYALVQYDEGWSLTASHELLEMLVDPFGFRMVPGDSLQSGQGRVLYLVEVCDPCESPEFAYTVNGVMVSDFYTPQYFDPKKAAGVRYSFTGAITSPREVLEDGYLSWFDPRSRRWHQLTFFGDAPEIERLGRLARFRSLREAIDGVRPNPLLRLGPRSRVVRAALRRRELLREEMRARADSLREEIEQLKSNMASRRRPYSWEDTETQERARSDQPRRRTSSSEDVKRRAESAEDEAEFDEEEYNEEDEEEETDEQEPSNAPTRSPREHTDREARAARERARQTRRPQRDND